MMEALREWLLQLLGATLLMAAVSALTPQNAARRIALLCCSVTLLLSVLRPLLGGELPALGQIASLEEALARQRESYQQENREQWESLIEAQLRTYIEGKAAELQCPCGAEVRVEADGDGGYLLREVILTAAEENGTLRDALARELGIPPERIRWRSA